MLYSRIVPAVKDIGLWGPRIRKAYADMGILGYAQVPLDALQKRDEDLARDLDIKRQQVEQTIALGKNSA